MQVLVWYLWFGHVLLRQNGHAYTIHYRYRVRVPVVRDFRGKIVVVCTASFETDPRAVDVIDTMLFKCRQEIRLLSTVTRLISSRSDSTDEIMPCSQSSREHWVLRFFAVGPISTLGLVGDSGRTVRSLSAASKPHITQRTARNTPSIYGEGEEHIFRVREFQFLLGKICV